MADPLSTVLSFLEAESVVSTGMKAGGQWAVRVARHEGLKFNAVVSGRAWLEIEGESEPIAVAAGDCFLLGRGLPFKLGSDLSLPAKPAEDVFGASDGSVATVGSGDDFHVVGGKMVLDPTSGALLTDALPDCIFLPAASTRAQTVQWLLGRFVAELDSNHPGCQTSAASLMHLMFIELIRAHLADQEIGDIGWLQALADPRIEKALRLIHGSPGHHWTLNELADEAAMSRSSFAHHFRARVGLPPLEYLLRWRMRLARRDLIKLRQPIGDVARRYGYGSESAFGTAFKRVFGDPPRRSVNSLGSSALGKLRG